MKKCTKKIANNLRMTIDMQEISLRARKFDTAEIGRGIGVHKSKKGKGSYNRKNFKLDDSCGCYFFC